MIQCERRYLCLIPVPRLDNLLREVVFVDYIKRNAVNDKVAEVVKRPIQTGGVLIERHPLTPAIAAPTTFAIIAIDDKVRGITKVITAPIGNHARISNRTLATDFGKGIDANGSSLLESDRR